MPGRARPPRRHGKVLAVNAGGGIIAIHAYLGASGMRLPAVGRAHHYSFNWTRSDVEKTWAGSPEPGQSSCSRNRRVGRRVERPPGVLRSPAGTHVDGVRRGHAQRRITRAIWPACCRRPPACASWKSQARRSADHVYLIAPSLELTMVDDYLRVAPIGRKRVAAGRPSISFRTLAEAHRERAIGIVLSGAGSDGSVGLSRVKEMGGITFARSRRKRNTTACAQQPSRPAWSTS